MKAEKKSKKEREDEQQELSLQLLPVYLLGHVLFQKEMSAKKIVTIITALCVEGDNPESKP